MEFNARHGYIAGIDLGPTRTRLAVADLRGQALAREIIATPSDGTPEQMLRTICDALRSLMVQAGVPADRLVVVVAGTPGAVDLDKGMVGFAPNLPGWTRVPMQSILHHELQTPVVIENDVNLALLGEHWQGAARGHDTCAFIFVGTGIGAAILIDGTLHHGTRYMAGEIGFMCMAPQYIGVDFGSRGCLEMLAGLDALRARWPLAAQEDPARWVAALLDAEGAGNEDARRAIAETARLIGMAAANVAAVVDPSLIILGGAMFAQAEPLVAAVREVIDQISRRRFEVVVSALGKEAPLAGCLLVGAMEARRHLRQKLKGAPVHRVQ
jgi:glucokinase